MANNNRRFGDRKEGRLVRSLSPISKIMPYLMPTKNDACNNYEESFKVNDVDRMLRKLRTEGYPGIGLLHFIIAAYVRCVSKLPGINRFIAGRRIYARDNIEVIMVVKRSMALNAEETSIKVVFEPTDTITDVYRKMNEKIDEIKTSDEANNTEELADMLTRLPRFILRFAVQVLRVMDYFGWIPQSVMDASPFHGSMIITDLGSLRINPVFHHLYNFGTLPVFLAFGAKYHKYEIDRHGQVNDNKYIDVKAVLDERTVDGHYYAQFLQAFRYLFEHPDVVVNKPTTVVEDIF